MAEVPAGTPEAVAEWLRTADAGTLAALQDHLIERQEAIEIELDDAAKAAIQAILDERGKTMPQLYGWRGMPKAKRPRVKKRTAPTAAAKQAGPQYKHPVTGELAKQPRGQPKAWLAELMEQGFEIEEFELQANGDIGKPGTVTWRKDGDRIVKATPAAAE